MELDRKKGYNYLKRLKFEIPGGIFQIFDSSTTSFIWILSKQGNLYSLNVETETLLLIGVNPNKNHSLIISAELFNHGSSLCVCSSSNDIFVYNLSMNSTLKNTKLCLLANPIKIAQPNLSDPIMNILFEGSYQSDHSDQSVLPLDGKMRNMNIPDNISYQSFKPQKFSPVAILSSSEDPLLTHKNTISSLLQGNNNKINQN